MFNFTRQERQAILFILTVALIGAGLDYLAGKYHPARDIKIITQDFCRIDLNKADKDLLMCIPGIKQKLAERIIAYRNQNSGINDIEELKAIKGLSEKKLEKIKEYILIK